MFKKKRLFWIQTEEPQSEDELEPVALAAAYAPELLQVPQPQPSPEPITTRPTAAPILQEPQVSAPTPTPIDRPRPAEAIFSRASRYNQPTGAPSNEELLYDLMVHLRYERDITEQDLADSIKAIAAREKRQKVIFTGDVIESWQQNEAFPKNKSQFDLACQILIQENPQIPEASKEAEVTKYGIALIESRALFYNTPGQVKSKDFGIFTSRYRRQLRLPGGEDELAVIFTERSDALNRDNVPTEDMERFDYKDIARIQNGTQKASPGLVRYMIRALNGEAKDAKELNPLSEDVKANLQTYLEKVSVKTAPTRNYSEESQITPAAMKLRSDLMAMFKDENGEPMSQREILDWGKTINPKFSAFNVSNYLAVGATQYNSLREEKAAEVKDVLGKVLQSFEKDPAKINEFSRRFDQLTEIYMAYKQANAKPLGPRPKSAAGNGSQYTQS